MSEREADRPPTSGPHDEPVQEDGVRDDPLPASYDDPPDRPRTVVVPSQTLEPADPGTDPGADPDPDREPAPPPPQPPPSRERSKHADDPVVPRTRAASVWVFTSVAIIGLILLIVFIAQNTSSVDVTFLGWTGGISLGLALLIAAVVGALLVAVAGIARVLQLRLLARRNRDLEPRR